uniref:Kazal-like domain-containing protein n=1 Tax=Anopheles dirus TaxID=7168 RepID=A0A182NJ97_9DIPT
GTCWLRRFESSGKCSQLFARNVTRESCCGAGSGGGKGFSERDIPDVSLFFLNAFNDGMECTSCLDTCDRTKCGPNKRCVMRRNRPKCICAPTCSGGGGGGGNRRRPQAPKRNNRLHTVHQHQEQRQQQHQQQQQQPRFHQQNIKVINLSESQRNRRQYFADAGRQPRPRQLRYTGPDTAGDAGRARTPSGCPAGRDWTGGERIVLQQNGLALHYPTGGKGGPAAKGKAQGGAASAAAPPTRRHHHRKDGPVRGNRTLHEQTHRKPSTAAPFVAFGKPKLLRVPRVGRKQNGTAVRIPRREPNYLDDAFFMEHYHHQRKDRKHQARLPVEDYWGNEIMHQTNFYNPVCGTDGRTYKTECQLKKRACRQELTSLLVAYKGHCQTSCKFVQCPDGKRCIEDQNAAPHCVSCGGAECRADRSPKSVVCGTDGITYPSICELKRQACLVGRAIPVAYRGRCIDPSFKN